MQENKQQDCFTNTQLAEKLMNEYKLSIIGTLQKNKPQIPPEFISNKHPKKTIMLAFQGKFTLVLYIPQKNKNILLL